jgi:thiamine monophosphate synthase
MEQGGKMRALVCRIRALLGSDDGMTTAEYAIGTIAAAALAAVLYTVVTGDSVVSAITGLIDRALSVRF